MHSHPHRALTHPKVTDGVNLKSLLDHLLPAIENWGARSNTSIIDQHSGISMVSPNICSCTGNLVWGGNIGFVKEYIRR